MASRCERSTPSNVQPIRSIAARDRALRTSVCRQTHLTCQVSNACVSIRRFMSVFAPVRMAVLLSQVQPISQMSGAGGPAMASRFCQAQ